MNHPITKPCSRCRKTKTIVHSVRRMGYCETCKPFAPTPEEFDQWLNEKTHVTVNNMNVRRGSRTNVFGRSK